jgi:DNA-binding NtrC family response regulator
MPFSIVLVEDDRSVRDAMAKFLRLRNWHVVEAESCRAAHQAILDARPDALVADYSLPDGNGLDLLQRLKAAEPELPIILLTAYGTIDLAVTAVKEGAEQFFTKPVDLPTLDVALRRAVENARSRAARAVQRSVDSRDEPEPFLGASPAIRQLQEDATRTLESPRPVLLLGETGTGKGVLARWLHRRGPRADEAFVGLNCAGLSRELLESELFGYERGAFTGATGNKLGLLEAAHHGTLFLDEVGELSTEVQPKLLTVLEDQRFRRLGSIRDRAVDVKFVSATHHDLEERSRQGGFRADLYYRIAMLPLVVPPLRERGDDVIELAERMLARIARELGRGELTLAPDAHHALSTYDWPGNVRELRNVLERAALFAEGGVINGQRLLGSRTDRGRGKRPTTLQEAEEAHIAAVMRETGGRVDAAAEILGLSKSALYDRLRKQGPAAPRTRAAAAPRER